MDQVDVFLMQNWEHMQVKLDFMILVNQETLLSCHVSRRSANQETLFPSHVSRIKLWRNQETLLPSHVLRRWANRETFRWIFICCRNF